MVVVVALLLLLLPNSSFLPTSPTGSGVVVDDDDGVVAYDLRCASGDLFSGIRTLSMQLTIETKTTPSSVGDNDADDGDDSADDGADDVDDDDVDDVSGMECLSAIASGDVLELRPDCVVVITDAGVVGCVMLLLLRFAVVAVVAAGGADIRALPTVVASTADSSALCVAASAGHAVDILELANSDAKPSRVR